LHRCGSPPDRALPSATRRAERDVLITLLARGDAAAAERLAMTDIAYRRAASA
jgi:hypothetical protein